MGNWLVVCRHKRVSCLRVAETSKSKNTVQVSEIVDFSKPILVKDVLRNHSSFSIALSDEAPLHHPRLEAVQESRKFEKESVKQIKVVITKQQLKELLSNEALADDFIIALKSENDESIWKPELETIQEEHEPS